MTMPVTKPPEAPPARLWRELVACAGRLGWATFYGGLILLSGAGGALGGAMIAMVPGAIGCEGLGFCGEWTGWVIYTGAVGGGLLGINHGAKIIDGFRRRDRFREELEQREDRKDRH